MKKRTFTTRMISTVESAAPATVWGKGVPGKGGKTTNSTIIEKAKEENK